MKGDRVEVLVDSGAGTVQRFEIAASRAGRRIEVANARGVVEVTEVTRSGTPVRSGRFMASRVVAIVEHPAQADDGSRVEEVTRRRMERADRGRRGAGRSGDGRGAQLELLGAEPVDPDDALVTDPDDPGPA
jgi:hypothetical protein